MPQIAEIPILASVGSRELYVPISNRGSQTITLLNFNQAAVKQQADGAECQVVQPGKSCLIKITIARDSVQNSGSLTFTVLGKDHQQHYTAQTIIYYHVVSEISGLTLPRQINYNPKQPSSNGYLLIPLVMEHTFAHPQISLEPGNLTTKLVCTAETSVHDCSLIVDLSRLAATTTSLHLSIASRDALKASYQAVIAITPQQGGNLVVGRLPLIIAPANGSSTKTVTLLNNGTLPLTLSAQSVAPPLAIESNNCNSITLASADSCTFQLSAASSLPGSQQITIDYTSDNQAKSISFTAAYYPENMQPQITATSSANFNSIAIGASATGVYTFYNVSAIPLIYYGISNISRQDVAFSEDLNYSDPTKCMPLQILASGQACTIQIQYQPTSKTRGKLALIPIFSYSNNLGEILTFSSQAALIPYSAGTWTYFYFAASLLSLSGKLGRCDMDDSANLINCVNNLPAYEAVSNRLVRSFLQVTESSMYIGFSNGNNDAVAYLKLNDDGSFQESVPVAAKPLYRLAQPMGSQLTLNAAGDSQIYGMGIYESRIYLANKSSRNSNDIQIASCKYSPETGDLTNCSGLTKNNLLARGFSTYSYIVALTVYHDKIYISTEGTPKRVYRCALNASTGDLADCAVLDIRDQNGNPPAVQLRLRTIVNNVAYLVSYINDQIWVCNINRFDQCTSDTAASPSISDVQSVVLYGQKLYVIKQTSSNNVVLFNLDKDGLITNINNGENFTVGDYLPVAGIGIAF